MIDNIQLVPMESNAVISQSNTEEVYYSNVFDGVDITCKAQLQGFSGKIDLVNIDDIKKVKFYVESFYDYDVSCNNGKIIISIDNEQSYELSGTSIINELGKQVGTSYFSLDNNGVISMEYDAEEDNLSASTYSTELLMSSINLRESAIIEKTVFSENSTLIEENYNYIGTYYEDENTNNEGIVARMYVKFNLSQLAGIEYDQILSAYYLNEPYEYGEYDEAEVYFVKDSWDENSISWNNLPATGKKIFGQNISLSYTESKYYGRFRTYYITGALQAWMQGMENNGIMLKTRNDDGWCKISSHDSSSIGNCLVVIYSRYSDIPTTKGVETGNVYYLLNKNSKKALSVSELASGADIVQKTYDMSEEQEWMLLHNTTVNGVDYYLLKTSGLNYFLQTDMTLSHESCVSIALGTNIDDLLWQIKRNWDGSYKLLPKNQNSEKALSVHGASFADNAYVCIETATVDFYQEDDWTLIPVERDKATLYGLDLADPRVITVNEVNKVTNKLTNCGYSCIKRVDKPADELISHLFDSQVWYFSSHGNASRMIFQTGNASTGGTEYSVIGLIDGVELEDEDSEDNVYVTVNGIKDYDGDMNRLQLSFMNSCSTGKNNISESLVGAMYEEGAHCIVSYIRECGYISSQEWYGLFNLALNKLDVETASIFADRMLLHSGISNQNTNARHVLGDTSVFYNYEAIAVGEETYMTNTIGEETNEENENAHDPISEDFISYTDSSGNLYGRIIGSNATFYLMNRRNVCFEGDYVCLNDALTCCNSYLNKLGYNTSSFDYESSNDYSSEFIIEFNAKTDVAVGEVEKIIMYVEVDSNNTNHVTFFKAIKKEG